MDLCLRTEVRKAAAAKRKSLQIDHQVMRDALSTWTQRSRTVLLIDTSDSGPQDSTRDRLRFWREEPQVVHGNIVETMLAADNAPCFRLLDVSSLALTRPRTWTPYFDEVHAIVFVLNVMHYDQHVRDGESGAATQNLLQRNLQLFDRLCNLGQFKDTSVLVLLNRKNGMEQRLRTSPFKSHFPDYSGKESSVAECVDHISTLLNAMDQHRVSRDTFVFTVGDSDDAVRSLILNTLNEFVAAQNIRSLQNECKQNG